MDDAQRIVTDPKVLVGKPVVRGTRLSVDFVLGLLADRWSRQEILEQYPSLTDQDITACLEYARDVLRTERVFPTK
ncbi:MAG: DUF433 domain-containing protein [Micropepsaceae bacterium]